MLELAADVGAGEADLAVAGETVLPRLGCGDH